MQELAAVLCSIFTVFWFINLTHVLLSGDLCFPKNTVDPDMILALVKKYYTSARLINTFEKTNNTLVNVYVDLLVFKRVAGTS